MRRVWLGMIVMLATLLGFVGCDGCGQKPPLAVLAATAGSVQRDRAATVGDWQPAARGAEFRVGDGLRTGRLASASVRLDDGAALQLRSETSIRFLQKPPEPDTLAFDVATGEATVEAGARGLAIETSVGIARIEPGTRVSVSPGEDGLRFVVEVGRARIGDLALSQAGTAVHVNARGQAQVVVESPPTPPEPVDDPGISAEVRGSEAKLLEAGGAWQPLAEGTSAIVAGSKVELGEGTSLLLQNANRTVELFGKGRFVVAPEHGVLVATEEGRVIAGSGEAVRVAVPGGSILVAPKGKAELSTKNSVTKLKVLAESATIETEAGDKVVEAGQDAVVGKRGKVSHSGVSLPYADLAVPVGQSVTVHDPTPPTAVRFDYAEQCPERGVVEVLRGSALVDYAVGSESVSLGLPKGVYGYRVRCLLQDGTRSKEPIARGRLAIVRDRATRGIAARAPVTRVIADGRRYTVLYQNRLPSIDLSWPHGPEGVATRLRHETRGVEREIAVKGLSHRFLSGKLGEGRHAFQFEGAGRVSRRTVVDIRFDNAAPTASLRTPPVLDAAAGQEVTVSGTALPGSEVLVEGKPPRLDSQGRFAAQAVLPEDRRALSVTIRHPKRGTHIYLRRGGTR